MAADVIIHSENLGKKYIIGHDSNRRGSTHVVDYKALRDVLAAKASELVQSAGQRLRGDPPVRRANKEEFWALKNLDFEVRRGDALGVIGRNGAGKSTLLKVLSRITEPSEGRVTVRGRVASLLEVGTGFHPELTGRENIFLNGAVLGMSRAEVRRKFEEIVDFAEVERFLDTPIKRYSSGMYVRLAFAVAAFLEQDILVVDEVLAVGDLEFQRKCLGKMSDVARGGRTVLFVSHNMGSIAELCQVAILLHAGRIVASGSAKSVIESYLAKPTASAEAAFDARPGRPCITGVRLDEQALNRGDFIAEVDFVSPFPLRPPVIGIVVSNQLGIPVWGTNGRFHPWPRTDFAVKDGTVVCEARKLPLASASYRLSVWLSDWHEDYEERPDVLSFDFRVGTNITQRPPPHVNGNLDWAPVWRMAGHSTQRSWTD
jgi:lipopolysaccharide transport system ATP-binding protein